MEVALTLLIRDLENHLTTSEEPFLRHIVTVKTEFRGRGGRMSACTTRA